eukprot:g1748.t1
MPSRKGPPSFQSKLTFTSNQRKNSKLSRKRKRPAKQLRIEQCGKVVSLHEIVTLREALLKVNQSLLPYRNDHGSVQGSVSSTSSSSSSTLPSSSSLKNNHSNNRELLNLIEQASSILVVLSDLNVGIEVLESTLIGRQVRTLLKHLRRIRTKNNPDNTISKIDVPLIQSLLDEKKLQLYKKAKQLEEKWIHCLTRGTEARARRAMLFQRDSEKGLTHKQIMERESKRHMSRITNLTNISKKLDARNERRDRKMKEYSIWAQNQFKVNKRQRSPQQQTLTNKMRSKTRQERKIRHQFSKQKGSKVDEDLYNSSRTTEHKIEAFSGKAAVYQEFEWEWESSDSGEEDIRTDGKACINVWYVKHKETLRPPKPKVGKIDDFTFNLIALPSSIVVYQRDYVDGKYQHIWASCKRNRAAEVWCEDYTDFNKICSIPGTTFHEWMRTVYARPIQTVSRQVVCSIKAMCGNWFDCIISATRLHDSEKYEYMSISWVYQGNSTENNQVQAQKEENSSALYDFPKEGRNPDLNKLASEVFFLKRPRTPSLSNPSGKIDNSLRSEENNRDEIEYLLGISDIHPIRQPMQLNLHTYEVQLQNLAQKIMQSFNWGARKFFSRAGKRKATILEIKDFIHEENLQNFHYFVYDYLADYDNSLVDTNSRIFATGDNPRNVYFRQTVADGLYRTIVSVHQNGSFALPQFEVLYRGKTLFFQNVRLIMSSPQYQYHLIAFTAERVHFETEDEEHAENKRRRLN